MTVANCLVDLIDVQGSSVLVCFEDGWDATPQVTVLNALLRPILVEAMWQSSCQTCFLVSLLPDGIFKPIMFSSYVFVSFS